MSKSLWNTRRGFLLLGGLVLAGCGTTSSRAEIQDLQDAAQIEYRLGPGDQLRITVFNEPDLTGEYAVSPRGVIAYPLVGEVEAAGLTLTEFTERLRQALVAYVRAPNISIEVANYRPFFILGEVQRPGTYPYSAHLTVPNAVATAGGFTYRANRGRVYIKHANEADERAYPLTTSTPVLPGDTVRIGERLF